MRSLLTYANTDLGNGERFAALHRGRLLHVHGKGWHAWTGTHWEHSETGSEIEGAKAVTRAIAAAARLEIEATGRTPTNPATGKPLGQLSAAEIAEKWATASQSAARIFAMLDLAKSESGMAATGKTLDRDPYALNVADCTINLRTGETRDHDPADRITRVAPASLRETGPSDRWLRFLDEALPDPRLQIYVQRAVGCSLIGRQDDHVIFLAYGGGGNGKGTLVRALRAALGPYLGSLPAEAVTENQSTPHPTMYADLFGKRMVVTDELPRNKKLDEGKLKGISGGDTIKARFMREDFFEFVPSHTIWLFTNDKPRITGTDNGIWRRLRLIPFVTTIPAHLRDPTLDDQLAACRNAVLQWAVEGARLYALEGLGTCDAVDKATDAYRAEEDFFGAALADLTDEAESATIAKTDLRQMLAAWYTDSGYAYPPNDRTIKQEMEKRGFLDKHASANGVRSNVWVGLAAKPVLPDAWKPKQPEYRKTYHDRD